ncbi:hypothetical protein O181_127742 [Austropuccinia psidii MF-1]|uniref:Uncharacterized protein n=1 Tax=Austropuccinia psidii MF-1 TaxID=1389203 RepID=A0A9Q3KVX2_9BASI|nr:hypothetical protein [Austropuccinia psidii MF-1]
MPQTLANSTEFHGQTTSVPESGSEISDMVTFISAQPPSSQKPNFKSYEKEKTVEPCAPTENSGQDDVIFSGEVEILSKEQFVSNISQTIPRLKKIQNDSEIPDYVRQKIAEAMSLLKVDLNCVEVGESLPEGSQVGDEMINVKVGHIDNQRLHTESPPILNETIHDETPPASCQNIKAFQERETIEHDTMGQDITDIIPDPEPKVSSSANFQGIFLSHMEEFGGILNYHSNINQQSWKRGPYNINRIYKNQWENLPTKDAHTFLPVVIKVISNQELKMLAWLGDLDKIPPKHGAEPNQLKRYQTKEETHLFLKI